VQNETWRRLPAHAALIEESGTALRSQPEEVPPDSPISLERKLNTSGPPCVFGRAQEAKRTSGGGYQRMPELIEESRIALWRAFWRRRARLRDRRKRVGGEATDVFRGAGSTVAIQRLREEPRRRRRAGRVESFPAGISRCGRLLASGPQRLEKPPGRDGTPRRGPGGRGG